MCTEAGLFAIRAERDYVLEEDFMKVCKCWYLSVTVQADFSMSVMPYAEAQAI